MKTGANGQQAPLYIGVHLNRLLGTAQDLNADQQTISSIIVYYCVYNSSCF